MSKKRCDEVPWSFMSLNAITFILHLEQVLVQRETTVSQGLSASSPPQATKSHLLPHIVGPLEFYAHDRASGTLTRMRWQRMADGDRAYLCSHTCPVVPLESLWILLTKLNSKIKLLKISKWQLKCIKLSMRPFWARDLEQLHSSYTHEASPPQRSSLVGWGRARRNLTDFQQKSLSGLESGLKQQDRVPHCGGSGAHKMLLSTINIELEITLTNWRFSDTCS